MTNFWNFAGWTILGLGIISGLIGIAKSIRKFFSSEYKKSEQRKIVNNNLNQICEEITEDMKNQLENGKEIIFENIENIKVDLNAPIDNYEHMKEQLKKADKNLEHIFNHIKKEYVMNETLKQFKENQEINQKNLKKLLDFINTGEQYGINIENSFKEKINSVIKNIANQKLKVALIGGFSEGKTSIAAAWIERLDKTSMKIDHQESSDEVKIYNIDDEIELVDTPGLFGFKEKISDNGKIEHYKDITKKYISEAHLILYVLNPSNPIKESHKDDLIWLFRTLNLLPRTIFVISRFDEEVDIEDEEDYNRKFNTKKENIQNRLNELISLSEKEKENLVIVAVAANPFDCGVEYWLKHKEEFQKLSRIKTLQNATQKKIKENGGKLTIIEEAKKASFKMLSIDKYHLQKNTARY